MKKLNLLSFALLVSVLAGCSTTTVRSIQEMESHNGDLVLKYGEVKYRQNLFSTELVSNEQKVANCKQTAEELDCKSLKVAIDGEPLVLKKK